jgi:hypothetical protein
VENTIALIATMSTSRLSWVRLMITDDALSTGPAVRTVYAAVATHIPRASLVSLEIGNYELLAETHLLPFASSPDQYLTKNRALPELFCFPNLERVELGILGGFRSRRCDSFGHGSCMA